MLCYNEDRGDKMSENVKEDIQILNAARKEKDAEAIYDAIKMREYRNLVEKCVEDLKKKNPSLPEKDLDLYL